MTTTLLKVCIVVVAAASVASARKTWGPMPTYHRDGMKVGQSEISIEVPAPETRDPEKCEIYENVDYMEVGCEQHCTVNGFFGNIRIQDTHARKVETCKSLGSFCRVPIITHAEMNVTFTSGRCNADCQCQPVDSEDYMPYGVRQLVASLLSSRHHSHRRHYRLHGGQNNVGVIKLRVPGAAYRNQTACEDYENSYFSMQGNEEWQCQEVCTLSGNIGSVQFEGAPRRLNKHKADGTYCELHSNGQGKIALKGVEQVINGMCSKGVCRPMGWKEPEEATTGIPAAANDIQVQPRVVLEKASRPKKTQTNEVASGESSSDDSE